MPRDLTPDEIHALEIRRLRLQRPYEVEGPGGAAVEVKTASGESVDVSVAPGSSLPISLADSVSVDAFSRLRVSEPRMLFDSKFLRGTKEPLFWTESTTGTGGAVANRATSSVLMSVQASGDECVRQTRARVIYQPGRSLLVFMTFVPPDTVDANVTWRVGFFDDDDGVFLEHNGSEFRWVLRTSTSGSPVDAALSQSSWDDPMDGTGTSGVTLTETNSILLWLDLQWLSLGRVRVGFDIDGVLIPVAELGKTANTGTLPYMKNCNLPLRYSIEATGTPGATRSLRQICCAAASEGGYDPVGLTTSIGRDRSSVTVNSTYGELLAFRVKSADSDFVRAVVKSVSVMTSTSGNIHWALLLNPTGLTGTRSWSDAGADSSVEYSTASMTGWSRGNEDHVIAEGYFSSDLDATMLEFNTRLMPGKLLDGTVDIVSLMAANASAGTNETMFASLVLDELF